MTAITAASAPTLPMAASPPPARATAPPPAPAPRAEQPAVINDVASQGAGGAGAVSGEERPSAVGEKVSQALEQVGSYNRLASIQKYIAWDMIEAKFGKAVVEENKQVHARALQIKGSMATESVAELQRQPGVSGLSVTRREDGSMAVSEFSFTDAGSTYTMERITDGRMVGLKDGQGWQVWQVDPPASSRPAGTGAAVALATLQAQPGSNSGKIPTNLLA